MHPTQISTSLYVQILSFIRLNFKTFLKSIFSLSMWKTLAQSVRMMKKDKAFKVSNVMRAIWNMIRYEKLIFFNKELVYNSFLPPINSKAFISLLKSVPSKSETDIFKTHVSGKRSAPLSMYIAITNQCPYNCWHCSADKYMQSNSEPRQIHSLSKLKKLITNLQDMNTPIIGFTGGEPMTRGDIFEIIGLVDDRSKSILFTNGYNLNYFNALRLKERGLWAVGISLDGVNEDKFNKMRGCTQAYSNSVNAIKACKQAGIYTMIQAVATKQSIKNHELEELAKFANSLKVDEVRILETYPMGKLSNQKNILLNEGERDYLYNFHVLYNQKLSYTKISCFAYIEDQSQFGCGAGVQHSYIDSDGNLRPCDFVPLNFGNVYKKSINSLWNEMNSSIKLPHQECFILKYNNRIQAGYDQLQNPNFAKQFCTKCQGTNLPLNYKLFAGKKQTP
jgi:MoaA/NifB/PqqE/SkfB family radical SAM enzyme